MLKNNKGFTLIELVVVMLLMTMLVGLGGGALNQYTHRSMFRYNNECAQTMFSLTQNAFTHAKESGELADLQDLCDSTTMADDVFGKVTEASFDGADQVQAVKDGRIYYVILNRENFSLRQAGTLSSLNPVGDKIYDMIDSYLYDKSYLDACICVEFDPKDGIVYSVSYSDKANHMTYDPTDTTARTPVSMYLRDYKSRYINLLGYYDAGQLCDAAPAGPGKTEISEVQLVNDETLHLQWALGAKYQQLTPVLEYNIEMCDAATGNPRLSFTINDKNSQIFKDGTSGVVEADVTLYDKNGTPKKDTQSKFPVYVKQNDEGEAVVSVVLDAVDLAITDFSKGDGQIDNSFSFSRFGIEPGMMYGRVQAAGQGYSTSLWKESNNSHNMMADETIVEESKQVQVESQDGTKSEVTVVQKTPTYGFSNARHLFNIRYMEDTLKMQKDYGAWKYLQESTFAWSGKGGILTNKTDDQIDNVYTGITPAADKAVFPAISKLDYRAAVTQQDTDYTINRLIVATDPEQSSVNGTHATPADSELVYMNPTGLFKQNEGTISKLSFKDAKVSGGDYTGIVCGLNSGILEDIKTSGEVTGRSFVGGICGQDISGANGTARTYTKLDNEADVSGELYVGGILGSLNYVAYEYNSQTGVWAPKTDKNNYNTISECINKGKVLCNYDSDKKADNGGYVGGIIGYNNGGHIVNCRSAQKYTDDEVKATVKAGLQGICVGGIVGYDRDGVLEGCSTGYKDEDGNNQYGYVLGHELVGGIYGYRTGSDGSQTLTIDGKDSKGKIQANNSTVIADSYAGGIIGANSKADLQIRNKTGYIEKFKLNDNNADKYHEDWIIRNWNNGGIVLAGTKYAGGITGYNEGLIEKCNSIVDATDGDALLAKIQDWNLKGDYVGGVAGLNIGHIDKMEGVQTIQTGGVFVGGIAGLNKDAAPANSNKSGVRGGTITAKTTVGDAYISGDAFVGGLVGCNTSEKVVTNEYGVNFSTVAGGHFAGGAFGANVAPLSADGTLGCTVNAEEGDLSGTSYVGGIVGYNRLVGSHADVEKFAEDVKNLESWEVMQKVQTFGKGNDSKCTLTINKAPVIRSITADVVVGGVVGYNSEGSKLVIADIANSASIDAGGAVAEQSVAGGIIGWAEENVTVKNCYNKATADIASKSGYAGGITSRNEGTITACPVKNIGNSKMKYLGGLVGLNLGTISDTNINMTATVTGNGVVGGIAADNRGKITLRSDTSRAYKVNVSAQGDYAGGLAAVNSGVVRLIGYTLQNSVKSTGSYVGGAFGQYLVSGATDVAAANTADAVVDGRSYVAGYFGQIVNKSNSEVTLKGYINKAKVTATTGAAAGIAADNDKKVVISRCENRGRISTAGSPAGGIAGVVDDNNKISECNNFSAVSSDAGVAAGIAGKLTGNNIEISKCRNQGDITAKNKAAGIACGFSPAGADSKSGYKLSILDCVNAGDINADACAGIFCDNSSYQVDMTYCRNYGLSDSDDFYGFCIADNSSKTVSNCFQIPEVKDDAHLIRGASNKSPVIRLRPNYYLVDKASAALVPFALNMYPFEVNSSTKEASNAYLKKFIDLKDLWDANNGYGEGYPFAEDTYSAVNVYKDIDDEIYKFYGKVPDTPITESLPAPEVAATDTSVFSGGMLDDNNFNAVEITEYSLKETDSDKFELTYAITADEWPAVYRSYVQIYDKDLKAWVACAAIDTETSDEAAEVKFDELPDDFADAAAAGDQVRIIAMPGKSENGIFAFGQEIESGISADDIGNYVKDDLGVAMADLDKNGYLLIAEGDTYTIERNPLWKARAGRYTETNLAYDEGGNNYQTYCQMVSLN